MDKTYAETRGQAPFDWNLFLEKAINDPSSISDLEYGKIFHLSGTWVTCACGNQCAIIPRSISGPFYGSPVDILLNTLGMALSQSVKAWEWLEARNILHKIGERSQVLIKEELAKLNKETKC